MARSSPEIRHEEIRHEEIRHEEIRHESPRLVSILSLLASVLLLTAGTNLQGVLLPIRRQMEGSGTQQIGLLSSGWSFGFVLACLVVGRMVSAVGHVRSFAGLAAISASAALLLPLLNTGPDWIVLRVVIGFCFGGLSMIIESWLNERSGDDHRGGIFAAYMTITLLASLAGTLSLTFFNPMQDLPYTVMAIAVVLAIVPVTLVRSPIPAPLERFSINLRALYHISPSGVFGCFAVGLVSGAMGGLLPAYGLSLGLSHHGVAAVLAAALVGGALAYYPAGRISDRVDRRAVVIVLATLSAALCLLLVLRPHLSPPAAIILIGAFGFTQYPLYGVCVAMTNDRAREQSFSQVASELLAIYGTGTILGPPLAAALMRQAPRYLFLFMGVVLLVQAGFTAARIWRKSRTPQDLKQRSHPLVTAPNSMQVFRPGE
jgi:MFS family permease